MKDHRGLAREVLGNDTLTSLSSFTFDKVSQLDYDISTALSTIREWRNSFVPINRIPLDVLSLIPTHLPSQKDRFHATFVCRHWRRTFIQRATLWSSLYLPNGEVYVKTLLERAKGSPLSVLTRGSDPVSVMTLFTPHNKQISYLDFAHNYWVDIQMFSELNPGPFPLLRTLIISGIKGNGPRARNQPPTPLFSHATNLTEFQFHSEMSPFLNHFAFPNLTVFELSAGPFEGLRASQLLDFLETSPMLRTVRMRITTNVLLEGIPRDRLVVLPHVEFFYLTVTDGGPGYKLATHIGCPSVRYTLLLHEIDAEDTIPEEIFPASVSWDAIIRQYTRSPVEEVTLKIRAPENPAFACSITFQSPDATTIGLGFEATVSDEDDDEFEIPYVETHLELFSQASRIIRGHPLLANVKRLHISHRYFCIGPDQATPIVNEVGRIFKSVGPLEELTIHRSDLRPYLSQFFDPPWFHDIEQPVIFPPTKELTITHPLYQSPGKCAEVIVRLAKSQHALGMPFERVTVRMRNLHATMAERLRPWVGVVYFHDEVLMHSDD